MDDMTHFEDQFEGRVRAFARTGVRSVDSAAIARAVAVGRPRSARTGPAWRWLGLTFDRRALAIAFAIILLATLLGGALLVGARLLLPSFADSRVDHLAYFLDGDIYVADWDGTNAVRVVDGDADATCRVFIEGALVSPDERHIAYRSNWGNGCQGAITVIDPDGHVVSTFPADGWDIAWSPDSTRIATWLPEGEQLIGVYGIDGTRQAVLDGSRMCCGDYDPVWSPDGAPSILVKEGGHVGNSIWELPIDGSAPRRVPDGDPRANLAPAYSPDGARAAYFDSTALVIAAADGTQQPVLIEFEPGQHVERGWGRGRPLWSPTGDRIAVGVSRDWTFVGGRDVTQQTTELLLVDPTNGTVTTLASIRGRGPLRPLGFSPDGDRLLYSTWDEGEVRDLSLWSVNTDGSGARVLVRGTDVGGWLSLPADAEGSAPP